MSDPDHARASRCVARLWRWVAVAGIVALPAGWVYGQDRQKQVLVLYSTGRDSEVSKAGERQLAQIIERDLGVSIDYYSEHLDTGRFPDRGYRDAFSDFLRRKYGGQRFDVVIAMLDVAVEFLQEYRDDLFGGSPVIFFATAPLQRPLPNATGVVAEMNFGSTIGLATTLQPDAAQLFVVSGAGAREKQYRNVIREQFQRFAPPLTIQYLEGLPTQELERRLATLPERSIIFYLLVYQDETGDKFQPIEYLDRLAAVANRPIYSWVDSTLGHGVVGGRMRSIQSEIDAVSERAVQVLRGRPVADIPVEAIDVAVSYVDWRQLRRWSISESRVPPGTIVRFRNPSLWDRYKFYILGAAALVFAQFVLIGGLLVQAAQRRKAEREMRRSQAALSSSIERIHDLGARLLGAQEVERSRIARELHDDVSQQLALLRIDLERIVRTSQPGQDETATLASGALTRAQDVAKSVHDLSHDLHPARLQLMGLVASLESLQREFSNSGLVVTFMHEDVPAAISPQLALCVYRIVQEGIRNAIKHSRARYVSVRLGCNDDELVLTIADDGIGFDVEASARQGLGLISMQERLEPLGGAFTIHSAPSRGTRLEITVPLRRLPAAGIAVSGPVKVA